MTDQTEPTVTQHDPEQTNEMLANTLLWLAPLQADAARTRALEDAAYRLRLAAQPAPGEEVTSLQNVQESPEPELAAALNQNDAMRQELSHIGNCVADFARFLRVDEADADGSWPDIASRIRKLQAHCARNETLAAKDAEIERLRKKLQPQWFYHEDDQSSDHCRFSVHEVIDEDWGCEFHRAGQHLVHISTAIPGPDIWAVVHLLAEEEKEAMDTNENYLLTEYSSKEEAESALRAKPEQAEGGA